MTQYKRKKYADGGVTTEDASIKTNEATGTVENSRSEGLAKAIADKRAFEDKLNKIRETAPKATVYKKSGGSISSASKRADGCAVRGKTRA